MKVCTSRSRQRSQHVGNGTLAHHADSRNRCMDILLTGNDRLYIVLTKSWAAVVSTRWFMVFNIHICNGFLCKISYYNRITYRCEFKLSFFLSLYDTCNASTNSDVNHSILGLYNVYVVYLLETQRDGCTTVFHGYKTNFSKEGKFQ